MSEPKLNEAVTEALGGLLETKGQYVVLKGWPAPVTHGYFNRRMFLESFIVQAGMGVAQEKKDIMEYAGITEKEWVVILKEYMDKGVILKVSNPFGADMYKLDTRDINVQATP